MQNCRKSLKKGAVNSECVSFAPQLDQDMHQGLVLKRPHTSPALKFPPIPTRPFLTTSANVWSYCNPATFRLAKGSVQRRPTNAPSSALTQKRRKYLSPSPTFIKANLVYDGNMYRSHSEVPFRDKNVFNTDGNRTSSFVDKEQINLMPCDGGSENKHVARTLESQPTAETLDVDTDKLLIDATVACPMEFNLVRLYVGGTTQDTQAERAALVEEVYPGLRNFCRRLGYEFQAVDVHWGVTQGGMVDDNGSSEAIHSTPISDRFAFAKSMGDMYSKMKRAEDLGMEVREKQPLEYDSAREKDLPTTKKCGPQQEFCGAAAKIMSGDYLRNPKVDDHTNVGDNVQLLHRLEEFTTGPNFVTLLAGNTGKRNAPREIEAGKLEQLLAEITSPDEKELVTKWYKKDSNSLPPVFILQSLSKIAESLESGKDKGLEMEMSRLCSILQNVTRKEKSGSDSDCLSATELEIAGAVFKSPGAGNRCLYFNRLDDTSLESNDDKEAFDRVDLKLKASLLPDNIVEYRKTDERGDGENNEYLERFCNDFKVKIRRMIKDAIRKRKQKRILDPLYHELLEHSRICRDKSSNFVGMKDFLEIIYGRLKEPGLSRAFFLYGPPGCGKSSILAKLAKEADSVFPGAITIIRFIGTTPESSDVNLLLLGLIKQMNLIMTRSKTTRTASKEEIIGSFWQTIVDFDCWCLANGRHALIMLDSIDNLVKGQGNIFDWFDGRVFENVRIVATTVPWIPGYGHNVYPNPNSVQRSLALLSNYVPDKDHYIEIPGFTENDVADAFDSWLAEAKRTLSPYQREVAMHYDPSTTTHLLARDKNNPLFWRLRFLEACKWSSYTPVDKTCLQFQLQTTVRALFLKWENTYGRGFVMKTLTVITAASEVAGITECELEDILSLDSKVLKEIYYNKEPPIKRIPPLMLARLLMDLEPFLTEVVIDGLRVLRWANSIFSILVGFRYTGGSGRNRGCLEAHSAIVDYLLGTEDEKPQALISRAKVVNYRLLAMLPHHLIFAQEITEVRDQILGNYDWIETKLNAKSLRHVLNDYQLAFDNIAYVTAEFSSVFTALQYSEKALVRDPSTLPGQILGRLHDRQKGKPLAKEAMSLLNDVTTTTRIGYVPEKPILKCVGGPLGLTINCETEVNAVAKDSHQIWYCGNHATLASSTLRNDKLQKSEHIAQLPKDAVYTQVKVVNRHYLCLVARANNMYSIYILYSWRGTVLRRLKSYKSPILIHHFGNGEMLVVLSGNGGEIFRLSTCRLQTSFIATSMPPGQRFKEDDLIAGQSNYLVFACKGSNSVILYEGPKQAVTKQRTVYPQDDETVDSLGVDAMLVTHNEDVLILANSVNNDLDFYSLPQLERIKTFKGDPEDLSRDFRLLDENRLIFPSLIRNTVCIWDLKTGERKHFFKHANPVKIAEAYSEDTIVTVNSKNVLRVWYLDPDEELHRRILGIEDGFTWRFMKMHPRNPRYGLLSYEQGGESQGFTFAIYDFEKRETVRAAVLPVEKYEDWFADIDIDAGMFLDSKRIVLPLAGHRFILNLDSMAVDQKLSVVDNADQCTMAVCSHGQELISLTKCRKGICVQDIDSGDCVSIMSPRITATYKRVHVNSNGTYCVMVIQEPSPICEVLDIEERRFVEPIDLTPYLVYGEVLDKPILWTGNDDRCILYVKGILKTLTQDGVVEASNLESCIMCIAWDTKTASMSVLHDDEHMLKYRSKEVNESSEPRCALLLRDDQLLCACEDSLIRAFNLGGDLLYNLEGHLGPVDELFLSLDKKRLLSWSRDPGDLACILWDLKLQEKITMFVFDEDPGPLMSVGNCSAIVFHANENPELKFIHLIGDGIAGFEDDLSSIPEIFGNEEVVEVELDPFTDEEINSLRSSTGLATSMTPSLENSHAIGDNQEEDLWKEVMPFVLESDSEDVLTGEEATKDNESNSNGGANAKERTDASSKSHTDGIDGNYEGEFYTIAGQRVLAEELIAKSRELAGMAMVAAVGSIEETGADEEDLSNMYNVVPGQCKRKLGG